jgi:hypothetical protein
MKFIENQEACQITMGTSLLAANSSTQMAAKTSIIQQKAQYHEVCGTQHRPQAHAYD